MTTNKIAFIYLALNVLLIIVSLILGGLWLINTQVAFICSMLIIFASFYSYKGLINKKIEDGDRGDDRDLLDKIDDKFELHEEDELANEFQDDSISKEEFKEIYKEERSKTGGVKRSFSNLGKSWSGALGVFRLLAYGFLFVAILVLIRKEFFEPIAFLVGLSVVPLATMIVGFFHRT